MTRFSVYRAPRMRLSVARHEASHAVVAMALGIRVCKLELHETVTVDGEVGCCYLDLRYKQGPLRYAAIAMAGPVADHLFNHTGKNSYSAGDAKHIRDTGLGNQELWLLRDLVRPLVWKKRAAIERVTRALVKTGHLAGAEVRHLILRGKRSR